MAFFHSCFLTSTTINPSDLGEPKYKLYIPHGSSSQNLILLNPFSASKPGVRLTSLDIVYHWFQESTNGKTEGKNERNLQVNATNVKLMHIANSKYMYACENINTDIY